MLITHNKYYVALQKGGSLIVCTFGLKCPTLFEVSYDLP